MATGSNSSQENLRKAIGAIKDSTMVGMAKVNSSYKGLDVAILKATNHVEILPKEKHVRTILGSVSGSRPRGDVVYCIHGLTKRLAKTRTWVVALKTLIVLHRALREVDRSFCEELIQYYDSRGHTLKLIRFRDDSSPIAWDYSMWIHAYALYIEECLDCYRVLKYDLHRDYSRTKKFDTYTLLEHLPAMQKLLFRLLACRPTGAALSNFIIQFALSIVAAESVRLYVAITDGVLILVDKFFQMQHRDAVVALEIYRRSGEQAQALSEFFEMCRGLGFGHRQKYVKIEQAPSSFLAAMEEYVKDAPQTLMLPWKDDDDGASTPRMIAVPETDIEEKSPKSVDDESNTNGDKEAEAPPLIPDLLSWDDEPSQETSQHEETDPLGIALTDAEELNHSALSSELSTEATGWELALVEASTADSTSDSQTKDFVLDRAALDRLYENANTTTNADETNHQIQTNGYSYNPFEIDDGCYNNSYDNSNQAMYYYYPQDITGQQAVYYQQQNQEPSQVIIGYDYRQVGGIIPQQELTVTYQQQQVEPREEMPFGGVETSVEKTEMPPQGVPMQQQEDDPFGNIPVVEQDSSKVSQSSSLNLL